MNYCTVAQLSRDVFSFSKQIPQNIDLVVGIPRSGMLVASMLSLYLDVPLTDVEGLINYRIFSGGKRSPVENEVSFLFTPKNILVVDDSLASGKAMQEVQLVLYSQDLPHNIEYAVIYSAEEEPKELQYYYKIVFMPRVFEWNLINHGVLRDTCLDIDGVLCADPTDEQNDDGEKYLGFLQNAEPLWIPKRKIGWLVTCRLEKYRKETDEWLRKNGVEYGELLMMDYPDKASRIAAKNYGKFKGEIYKKKKAPLFIESSCNQAKEIVKISGKDVLCFETNTLVKGVR